MRAEKQLSKIEEVQVRAICGKKQKFISIYGACHPADPPLSEKRTIPSLRGGPSSKREAYPPLA